MKPTSPLFAVIIWFPNAAELQAEDAPYRGHEEVAKIKGYRGKEFLRLFATAAGFFFRTQVKTEPVYENNLPNTTIAGNPEAKG